MNSVPQKIVHGDKELIAALGQVAAEMRDAVLAEATKAAIQPIKIAAKRYAQRSRDTGALQASITDKVVNYPRNGKAVGLVGPDRSFYREGVRVKGRVAHAFARLQGGARRPAKYAHLVEFGHVIAKGGKLSPTYRIELLATGKVSKSGKPIRRWKRAGVEKDAPGHAAGFVPAKPFMRPAMAATQAEQAEGFYNGLERGYVRAITRAVNRNPTKK